MALCGKQGFNEALGTRSNQRAAQKRAADSPLLHLDYTTIRHHLGVLEKNHIVLTEGEKYGKLYFLSEMMEANWTTPGDKGKDREQRWHPWIKWKKERENSSGRRKTSGWE